MQRWLSWSKAHDWKSCVRLITDREFESLPLREIRKRIFMVLFFIHLWGGNEQLSAKSDIYRKAMIIPEDFAKLRSSLKF